MIKQPPRLPRIPSDEQPIDPIYFALPVLPDDYQEELSEEELLEMAEYEDPTVIDDWMLPYRPK